MSDSILNALMQLFSIITRPVLAATADRSDYLERRAIVEDFLKHQLNQELVIKYLAVFEQYYNEHQKRHSEKASKPKLISSSSVRVLKICAQINDELKHQQKIVVLVRLLEFVKPESGEVTKQEMAFVETVAETFNVSDDEFALLLNFVLQPYDSIRPSDKILIINSIDQDCEGFRHLRADNVEGNIKIAFVESANMLILRYFSDHELYLNGHLLQKNRLFMLNQGASLRSQLMKPIYYSDIVSCFTLDKIKERIVFEARDIAYRFKTGKIGLHRMSFTEESGHLVGIMGASGTGKTTLLNVLNGSEKPYSGQILINGYDIHAQSEQVAGQIGFVSQDDLLIEELTVYQNLYYNAKLCFGNYTPAQIEDVVNGTLVNLGLFDIRHMVVGSPLNQKISGGQRKRLNIALELIREPAILFLDEPTSGLSSSDSENILDLLKELTLKGKLVFVVIHQPSSDIFKMFDKLLLLDMGGYLIYNGDPIESIIYFKSQVQQADWSASECAHCGNVNPEQIFNIVEAHVLNEYGSATRTRKISPVEWHELYRSHTDSQAEGELTLPAHKTLALPKIHFKTPGWFKQLAIFVKRDVRSKLANRQYLIINALETPLLTFLLAYIIKYHNVDVSNTVGYTLLDNSNLPVYLFMAVIIAVFVGLTVSAEEIIKDRKIQKRETFLNLSWSSYLMSKVVIMLVISAVQALLFVLIGNSVMEIHGMYFRYWVVLFSVWFSSNMLGLVISDSFKTVVTIYILIPFLVIPQIILSGVIVKYEKLNPTISSPDAIPLYGELIVSRWAYEALAVEQYMGNQYQQPLYRYDEAMSVADFKRNYWLKSLQNKLDYCSRHLFDTLYNTQIVDALQVVRNEISHEQNHPRGSGCAGLKFERLAELQLSKLDHELIAQTQQYLDLVRKYYVKLYNKACGAKDAYIMQHEGNAQEREAFIELKRRHHNETLTEFVRNSKDLERIIEFKGRLIQKIDPIYLCPTGPFLRAHFYAPVKPFFGWYLRTFWANVAVIWCFSIGFYILLHYRLLKRLLDRFEARGLKKRTKDE